MSIECNRRRRSPTIPWGIGSQLRPVYAVRRGPHVVEEGTVIPTENPHPPIEHDRCELSPGAPRRNGGCPRPVYAVRRRPYVVEEAVIPNPSEHPYLLI